MKKLIRLIFIPLLFLALLIVKNVEAQIPEADLLITEAWQSEYLYLDAITKNKITNVREEWYKEIDAATKKADMKKLYKITIYGIGYLGDKALPAEQVAVFGTDTTRIVEQVKWSYYNTGHFYKFESNNQYVANTNPWTHAILIQRDTSGLITRIGTTFVTDAKNPPEPEDHRIASIAKQGNFVYAEDKHMKNGISIVLQHNFNYDSNNNLISAYVDKARKVADENEKTKDLYLYDYTYKYDNANYLVEKSMIRYYTENDYIPPQDSVTRVFDERVNGYREKTVKTLPINKRTEKEVNTIRNEYDAGHRLIKQTTTVSTSFIPNDESKNTSVTGWEEYTYNAAGLPEFIYAYNSEGLVWVKKLVCSK